MTSCITHTPPASHTQAYALRFSVNDKIKDMVTRPGQPPGGLGTAQLALAGTLSGLVQCVATHPLETIRSRM